MSRAIGAVLVGALFLAGCGGGSAPSAPGAPGIGDFKAKMPETMKPCDAANKATPKALSSYKSGKATLTEAMAVANAGVAACETAQAAWEAMAMPPPVAEACLAEARAKVELAQSQVAALNHQLAKPYKTRIDRAADAAAEAVKACKEANK
jgi:hypothetical protein